MSGREDAIAWQREWLERYEPEGAAPFSDVWPWVETGELVYARRKEGAPPFPLPRPKRNPEIEVVTADKEAAIVEVLGQPEQGSRARVR